jgi:hypothetical protein
MPITANIIQTMKHTVKAVVLAVTTDHALYVCDAIARPLLDFALPASLGSRRGHGLIQVKPKMYQQCIF